MYIMSVSSVTWPCLSSMPVGKSLYAVVTQSIFFLVVFPCSTLTFFPNMSLACNMLPFVTGQLGIMLFSSYLIKSSVAGRPIISCRERIRVLLNGVFRFILSYCVVQHYLVHQRRIALFGGSKYPGSTVRFMHQKTLLQGTVVCHLVLLLKDRMFAMPSGWNHTVSYPLRSPFFLIIALPALQYSTGPFLHHECLTADLDWRKCQQWIDCQANPCFGYCRFFLNTAHNSCCKNANPSLSELSSASSLDSSDLSFFCVFMSRLVLILLNIPFSGLSSSSSGHLFE